MREHVEGLQVRHVALFDDLQFSEQVEVRAMAWLHGVNKHPFNRREDWQEATLFYPEPELLLVTPVKSERIFAAATLLRISSQHIAIQDILAAPEERQHAVAAIAGKLVGRRADDLLGVTRVNTLARFEPETEDRFIALGFERTPAGRLAYVA